MSGGGIMVISASSELIKEKKKEKEKVDTLPLCITFKCNVC